MSEYLVIKIHRNERGYYVTAEMALDHRDWVQRTPYGPMSAAECQSLVCDLPTRFVNVQERLFSE